MHSDIPLTWYIVDIAVNTVFSVVAIIGNTFIIVAFWKLSFLQVHSVLKAFLFTLALADFGAGAIVNEQAGWFLTDDRDDIPCLRSGRWYCVLVKKKRFVTLLILLWLLTIAGMSLPLWNHNSYNAFANAVLTLFLILTTAPYLEIYPSLKQQNGR